MSFSNRSGFLWHIILALILSAALTLLLRWAGPIPMTIGLFLALTWVFIYVVGLARVLFMSRRPRMRPFGNGGGRGEWSGVREPRRPRPPHWPPRAAAVLPEDDARQEFVSAAEYGDIPQQSLRSEGHIA
jgi:hypothetical protein